MILSEAKISKYRILEKEGLYTVCNACLKAYLNQRCEHDNLYIPRFIVQEEKREIKRSIYGSEIYKTWADLIEFQSLEEARKCKRSLELKDGIVIE